MKTWMILLGGLLISSTVLAENAKNKGEMSAEKKQAWTEQHQKRVAKMEERHQKKLEFLKKKIAAAEAFYQKQKSILNQMSAGNPKNKELRAEL